MPRILRESVSIDVALARHEFLLALARFAPDVIADLNTRLSSPPSLEQNAAGQGRRWEEQVIGGWARQWTLDVPWLRRWALHDAVNTLLLAPITMNPPERWGQPPPDTPAVRIRMMTSLLGSYSSPPAILADIDTDIDLFDLVTRWRRDELPPDGGLAESKKEFLARMEQAFDSRREVLRKSKCLPTSKPALRQHAEWTVRYHLGGESIAAITARRGPNRTVEKAIKEFASRLGLPFPRPPRPPRPRLFKRT